METESIIECGHQAGEEGKMRSCCAMGTVSVLQDEKVLQICCQKCTYVNSPILYT